MQLHTQASSTSPILGSEDSSVWGQDADTLSVAAAVKETAPMGKGDGRRLLQPPRNPAMGGKTSCGHEGESKKGGGPDPALTDRLPGQESVQGTETSRLGH